MTEFELSQIRLREDGGDECPNCKPELIYMEPIRPGLDRCPVCGHELNWVVDSDYEPLLPSFREYMMGY